MVDETKAQQWGGYDFDHKPLGPEPGTELYTPAEQIQDQLTLDEQLDLERVEAAVVI
jgi:hypothetical protein